MVMSTIIRHAFRAVARVVPGVALIGCGMVVYKHTIEVVVSDPDQRLGPAPIDVSVFDFRMGSTADWARKTMGPTSDAAPYTTPFTSMRVATILDPPRPDSFELALAVPKLESRGYFVLSLEPGSRRTSEQLAAFVPYTDSFPADQVPKITMQYNATPQEKGWHVTLRVLVQPTRPR